LAGDFILLKMKKRENPAPGFSGAAAPGTKLPEGGMYGRRLFPCCVQDWP